MKKAALIMAVGALWVLAFIIIALLWGIINDLLKPSFLRGGIRTAILAGLLFLAWKMTKKIRASISTSQNLLKKSTNAESQPKTNPDLLSPLSSPSESTQITESKQAEEWVLRAQKYLRRGNYEKTFDAITKAIDLDPNYFRAYNIRGAAYYVMKKYSKALEDYYKATKLNPEDSRPYFNRALVYEKLRDRQQTIKELKEAARMGNKDAQEWLTKEGERWE